MTSLIQTQGRYFWKDGQRFLIRGVVYRLHGRDADASDPLVDDRLGDLKRDITLFQELGLNTLFIYHIDSTRSHDAAMKLLADAGIYVLISLPTSASSRDSDAGITTTFRAYSPQLLADCFATIDSMAPYDNTLGLVVANGALSTIYSTAVAPTIKTVIRDVKRYMATAYASTAGQQRPLPVGYSAANGRLILKTTFEYFAAGEPEETIDFFCYANFNWCGESTMLISGYDAELKTFAHTHIPVFFSQYGCHLGACGRRIFQETTALYAPAMTHVFSGGIAHEFYDCAPSAAPALPGTRIGKWGYGLVREEGVNFVGSDADPRELEEEEEEAGDAGVRPGRGLTKLPDFGSLRARLRQVQVQLQRQQQLGSTVHAPNGRALPVLLQQQQQQQQRRMSEETIDDEELLDDMDVDEGSEEREEVVVVGGGTPPKTTTTTTTTTQSKSTLLVSQQQQQQQQQREFPPLSAHWRAGYALPSVVADWKGVRRTIEEKMWIEVDAEEMHVSDIELDSQSPRLVRA